MYVDRFIENCPIALHNLNSEAITGRVKDQWKNCGNNYGNLNQEVNFHKSRKYYARFEYKYTSTTTISRLLIYFGGGGGENGTSGNFSVTSSDPTIYSFVGTFDPEFKDSRAFIIYQGVYPNPSDLVGYLRNVLLYDVTDLWAYLKAKGTVTDSSSSFKTWADANLEWRPYGESYTPTGVFAETLDSVSINKGTVIAQELVETDGMTARTVIVPTVAGNVLDPYFDTYQYPYRVYNNLGNGNVTTERVDAMAQGSPLAPEHKYVLKITTNGEASPGAGGVKPYDCHSKASRIYIRKMVAKIPVGYSLGLSYNPMGSGSTHTHLTNKYGTGKWEEYTVEEHSGATGTFSDFGHMYLDGPDNQHVTWYVAYYDVVDITDNPSLRGYTVLPNVHAIGKGTLFMREMNEVDLFPAGRTVKPEPGMLPSGWTYDTEDYAGEAKYSIVIPVGNRTETLGLTFPTDPSVRYKVSMWIKCKTATDYDILPMIRGLTKDGKSLYSERVFYIGTPTTLTADLNAGDTVVKVADTSTFQSGNYKGLGFRGHWGRVEGYNSLGSIPTGGFTITDSTTFTLAKPYSGEKINKGAVVVNSLVGSTYLYPFYYIRSSEYTWKYVEGYFGVDGALFDGKTTTSHGVDWGLGLSKATEYIDFALSNLGNKTNDPIKICDIRIHPYNRADGNGRLQGDVELKAYS